jgi:outer membrane receptor for ferrienterochelin and colicin
MPENFSSADQHTSVPGLLNPSGGLEQTGGNTFGGTAANIGGLGPGATLALLNGRRMAPAGSGGGLIDVSMIPLSAINRVEVLTGGASAIYGADAIAGVMNFILKKNFNGLEATFRTDTSTRGGGETLGGTLALGRAWTSGNAMLTYDVLNQGSIEASSRKFIPAVNWPGMIQPEQKRQSALFSGEQRLTDELSIVSDAYFSKRRFYQEGRSLFTSRAVADGSVRLAGGNLGASYSNISGSLNADLTGYVSEVTEKAHNIFQTQSTQIITESRLKSRLVGVDLQGDVKLLRLRYGTLRAALVGSIRKESISGNSTIQLAASNTLKRDIMSLGGELLLPSAVCGQT